MNPRSTQGRWGIALALAVALYDALQEAGMQFPFPQRKVRLLHDPEAVAAAVQTPGAAPPAMPDGRGER
jgi:small-conductance mechanosensitive channel